MSLTSSMSIAQQALAVNQAAITVTSNNIANIDTDSYSKQRVNLDSVVNYTKTNNCVAEANTLGGVQIANIQRYSDAATQSYYWQENSTSTYLNKSSNVASNVNTLMNELKTTGLSTALSNFYSAADALNNTPKDYTARQSYVSAASAVCGVFNNISTNLTNIKTSLVGDASIPSSIQSSEIASDINSVNSLLSQLAQTNEDIVKTNTADSSSAALLDKRDTLVTQLTALMPINAKEQSNGTISVSLGSYSLVEGGSIKGSLNVSYQDLDNNSATTGTLVVDIVDPNDSTLTLHADVTSELNDGVIGAIIDLTGSDSTKFTLKGVQDDLDAMASTFASALNAIQTDSQTTTTGGVTTTTYAMCLNSTGTALQSSADYAMFKSSDSTTTTINASNISVNKDIVKNANYVAAARTTGTNVAGVITPTDPTAVGNNSNVTQISQTRTNTYTTLGGATIESYLASSVAEVGSDVSNINSKTTNQTLVLKQISTKLESATGVNLEEELTDMIKFQRAYQAAARIFSVCSELTGELVNLGK